MLGVDNKEAEELLMSQVVKQKALVRLLVGKGIFTKEEFLEMASKD